MTSYYHSTRPDRRSFSVNIIRFLTIILPASFILFASSCEEKGNIIGKNLLPDTDFVTIYSTDTITIRSFTNYSDSIPSLNPPTSYLGQLYDPYFGTTSAEFVSQLRLGKEWVHDVIFIDSVKLILTFTNAKGVASGHFLQMSEIAKQIYIDTTYYSNIPVPLTGYTLPEIALPLVKPDSANTFVLDLPVSFGEYLTRDLSKLFHSNKEPDFRSFFKGLKFSLRSTGDPVFLSINLAPPISGSFGFSESFFVIYFHDELDVKDEYYFFLDAKTNNARFNIFKHNFSDPWSGRY
jgi:hypothetical protein